MRLGGWLVAMALAVGLVPIAGSPPDALGATSPSQAKVFRTKGYKGLRAAPAVGPQQTPPSVVFGDGELRVPMVDAPIDSGVMVVIDARDVSVALSRPMDVSITNRFPGMIVEMERLALPYVRVTFELGASRLHALVTSESVERLALEIGLRAWAMVKTVAIVDIAAQPRSVPTPRRWPSAGKPD